MSKRPSKSPKSSQQGPTRLLLATNRANVLPILSSGLIRPRAAYDKYYEDLLALCPGRVLLFHNTFPASLVPLVSSQEGGLFPVLVEVDPKRVPAGQDHLQMTPDLAPRASDCETGNESALCDVVGAPIPIASVKRLCFLSRDDLQDFEARDFDNLLSLPPLAVLPGVVSPGGPDADRFRAAAGALPPAAGTSDDFRRLDAAMGAIAMLSLLLPASKPWVNALAASLTLMDGKQMAPEGGPNWLTSVVPRILAPALTELDHAGVDGALLTAAIDVLCSSSPREGWVESKIEADIAAWASKHSRPEESREIESWRDVVVSAAKGERQAGPLDDSGSIIRRGLMLLVLRCKPERIAAAGDNVLRSGPRVAAIAGMLSGAFHGYSRLSREMKAQACSAALLSRLAVCWWSVVDGTVRNIAVGTTTRREDDLSARSAVTVDRQVFVDRLLRPDDTMMRLFYHAKGIGYSLEYDHELNAFVHNMGEQDGATRRIIIEPGRPTLRGQATIRVRTACLTPDGKPVRLSRREDAVALLERNHDPVTQCRFAVEPGVGGVEVLAHQLVETMDSPELQAHVEAVGNTAAEFERHWASRASTRQPLKGD